MSLRLSIVAEPDHDRNNEFETIFALVRNQDTEMISAVPERCHGQILDPRGSIVRKTRLPAGYFEADGHESGS